MLRRGPNVPGSTVEDEALKGEDLLSQTKHMKPKHSVKVPTSFETASPCFVKRSTPLTSPTENHSTSIHNDNQDTCIELEMDDPEVEHQHSPLPLKAVPGTVSVSGSSVGGDSSPGSDAHSDFSSDPTPPRLTSGLGVSPSSSPNLAKTMRCATSSSAAGVTPATITMSDPVFSKKESLSTVLPDHILKSVTDTYLSHPQHIITDKPTEKLNWMKHHPLSTIAHHIAKEESKEKHVESILNVVSKPHQLDQPKTPHSCAEVEEDLEEKLCLPEGKDVSGVSAAKKDHRDDSLISNERTSETTSVSTFNGSGLPQSELVRQSDLSNSSIPSHVKNDKDRSTEKTGNTIKDGKSLLGSCGSGGSGGSGNNSSSRHNSRDGDYDGHDRNINNAVTSIPLEVHVLQKTDVGFTLMTPSPAPLASNMTNTHADILTPSSINSTSPYPRRRLPRQSRNAPRNAGHSYTSVSTHGHTLGPSQIEFDSPIDQEHLTFTNIAKHNITQYFTSLFTSIFIWVQVTLYPPLLKLLSEPSTTCALASALIIISSLIFFSLRTLIALTLFGVAVLLVSASIRLYILRRGLLSLSPSLARFLTSFSLLDITQLPWSTGTFTDLCILACFPLDEENMARVLARLPPRLQRAMAGQLLYLLPDSVVRLLLPNPALLPPGLEIQDITEQEHFEGGESIDNVDNTYDNQRRNRDPSPNTSHSNTFTSGGRSSSNININNNNNNSDSNNNNNNSDSNNNNNNRSYDSNTNNSSDGSTNTVTYSNSNSRSSSSSDGSHHAVNPTSRSNLSHEPTPSYISHPSQSNNSGVITTMVSSSSSSSSSSSLAFSSAPFSLFSPPPSAPEPPTSTAFASLPPPLPLPLSPSPLPRETLLRVARAAIERARIDRDNIAYNKDYLINAFEHPTNPSSSSSSSSSSPSSPPHVGGLPRTCCGDLSYDATKPFGSAVTSLAFHSLVDALRPQPSVQPLLSSLTPINTATATTTTTTTTTPSSSSTTTTTATNTTSNATSDTMRTSSYPLTSSINTSAITYATNILFRLYSTWTPEHSHQLGSMIRSTCYALIVTLIARGLTNRLAHVSELTRLVPLPLPPSSSNSSLPSSSTLLNITSMLLREVLRSSTSSALHVAATIATGYLAHLTITSLRSSSCDTSNNSSTIETSNNNSNSTNDSNRRDNSSSSSSDSDSRSSNDPNSHGIWNQLPQLVPLLPSTLQPHILTLLAFHSRVTGLPVIRHLSSSRIAKASISALVLAIWLRRLFLLRS